MASIQQSFNGFLNTFLVEKNNSKTISKSLSSYKSLVHDIPEQFRVQANLPSDFIIEGSIGKGVITNTPWICFFDKEITKSAQEGYYICILFREDMSGFYLSLNQGWTQYENKFGIKKGRIEIELNSLKARQILRSAKGFDIDSLDLRATKDLGKGYERGNIYSYFYPKENLPSDKSLFEDLHRLIAIYRELKGLVGKNILNIRSLSSEEDFQEETQKSPKAQLPTGPIKKSEPKIKSSSSSWNRDPSIGSIALEAANHSCEYDSSHKTFISKSSGLQFVEVHHLVPMEKQNDFEVSLDVPENIIALCPTCHRKIHLASETEKQPMLDYFFKHRKEMLIYRGIDVDLKKLNEFYKQLSNE